MSALAAAQTTDIDSWGAEAIWIILLKVVAVFAFLVVMTLFTIVFERKVVGRMQLRIGPNRTGPWGTLQSLADGIKLAFKEEIVPTLADKPVYWLAPIISTTTAFLAFAVIPFGPEVSIFGHHTALQLTDLPVGALWVLACSALGVYGLILSGWASGSSYPLLGGLRSAAQVISYEIVMGLAIVGVFLYADTMSMSGIVASQVDRWNITTLLLLSFGIFCIAIVGETNRAPFDLPECESELVSGYLTEYSGFRYAMFFLAEYINMATVSAVATTLFLGGYLPPWPLNLIPFMNNPWLGPVFFFLKVQLLISVFVWLRGTLPRFRYDQFMNLGWKGLIPISLVWILMIAVAPGYTIGLAVALVAVVYLIFGGRSDVADEPELAEAGDEPEIFDAFAGGYPTPPRAGQILPEFAGVVSGRGDEAEPAGPAATEGKES